ncbi:ribonuclease P protein component [bacterium]|jgi:ribonuclease P protein component|nr:ribonuclease P protein component [bacterium]MBT4121922.1 ribonuclease P protein component [bacterium]MBT4335181.1 ribonuclease P protein component [bacterium]MBT4495426.1 ribonuclease P protein component [bacterium]MBT4763651.1 ribonuclease P protein component [bacterium]
MLFKLKSITKEKDFKEIARKGRIASSQEITLKVLKSDIEDNRFGIVISKKVSKKAIERNKLKRQIKEIIKLELKSLKNGHSILILVSPRMIGKEYNEIKEILLKLFKKANLYA